VHVGLILGMRGRDYLFHDPGSTLAFASGFFTLVLFACTAMMTMPLMRDAGSDCCIVSTPAIPDSLIPSSPHVLWLAVVLTPLTALYLARARRVLDDGSAHAPPRLPYQLCSLRI